MSEKYKVGTKILLKNPDTEEKFVGEIVSIDDPRMKGKIAFCNDICIWFEEVKFRATYDSDFLDKYAEPHP